LVHLVSPNLLALEKIDVHKLDDFIDDIDVEFSELSVFVDKFSCHLLHFLCVPLNLDGIFPSHILLGG